MRRLAWSIALAAIVLPGWARAAIGPNPQIELTKTVSTDGSCGSGHYLDVPPGTNVTFCYTATNTGDVTFTAHDLTDSVLGMLLTDSAQDLPPGDSLTYLITTAAISGTITNTAEWTGKFTDPFAGSAADQDFALVEGDADGDGLTTGDPHGNIFDPTGCFYDETTGKVIRGGLISISGPPGVIIGANGTNGCYQFTALSPGTYTINILQYPLDCSPSTQCLDSGLLNNFAAQCTTFDGTICTLGNSGVTGRILPSFSCVDNPFYLQMSLAGVSPDVLNNNIPLTCMFRAPAPAMSPWGLAIGGLLLTVIGFGAMRRMSASAL